VGRGADEGVLVSDSSESIQPTQRPFWRRIFSRFAILSLSMVVTVVVILALIQFSVFSTTYYSIGHFGDASRNLTVVIQRSIRANYASLLIKNRKSSAVLMLERDRWKRLVDLSRRDWGSPHSRKTEEIQDSNSPIAALRIRGGKTVSLIIREGDVCVWYAIPANEKRHFEESLILAQQILDTGQIPIGTKTFHPTDTSLSSAIGVLLMRTEHDQRESDCEKWETVQ
jgi:hypothetical protein